MATQGLIDRQRVGRDILHATLTHAREVGERLNQSLQFTVEEGETLPDFITFQHQLARLLESRLNGLEEADNAHLQELDDDTQPRARRDQAVDALYAKLIEARELVKGLFGTNLANALMGIDGPTPQDPLRLHTEAREVLERLREPDPELPPRRLSSVLFDRNAVADELQPFVEALGEALTDLRRESRERESTKNLRDAAIRNFDTVSRAVGRIQIGLDELAGFPDFADKIRLTLPGRGRRVRDEEELPEEPTPPAESPVAEDDQIIGFGVSDRTLPPATPERTEEPETS